MRGIPSLITDIRKNVFCEVAKMAYAGGDYSHAEDLPYTIVPGEIASHRESIFLERAIAGERVDGHDFIPTLDTKFQNVMFLCSKKTGAKHDELVCDDVLRALADVASLHLQSMPAKRVAVTGSVGKTTTKEMIACALSGKYSVQKSLANRNNELGMPLTAFTVDESHGAAIFEMGMRGKGQIDYLARRVRPKVGVITNIGVSHIELLGSRENICAAKMELANYIARDGVLSLNGDEPLLREAAKNVPAKVRFFSIDTAGDYRAENIIREEQKIACMRQIVAKHRLEYEDEMEFINALLGEIGLVKNTGIDIGFYNLRERDADEVFPWDFIDCGVTKAFLKREWQKALSEIVTPNCRMQCQGCGAMRFGGGVCFEAKN